MSQGRVCLYGICAVRASCVRNKIGKVFPTNFSSSLLIRVWLFVLGDAIKLEYWNGINFVFGWKVVKEQKFDQITVGHFSWNTRLNQQFLNITVFLGLINYKKNHTKKHLNFFKILWYFWKQDLKYPLYLWKVQVCASKFTKIN